MIYENTDIPVTELNEDASEIPKESGIYMYIDNSNGRVYVGKTVNLRSRYKQHQKNTDNIGGIDEQLALRPQDFDYRILIYGVNPVVLESLEVTYQKRYNAVSDGYNIRNDSITDITDDKQKLLAEYTKLYSDYIQLLETVRPTR